MAKREGKRHFRRLRMRTADRLAVSRGKRIAAAIEQIRGTKLRLLK